LFITVLYSDNYHHHQQQQQQQHLANKRFDH
jgi:hypothetical protein